MTDTSKDSNSSTSKNWNGIRVRDEKGNLLHIIKEHKDDKTGAITEEDVGETCGDPNVVMDFVCRRFEKLNGRPPRYHRETSKLKSDYKILLFKKDGDVAKAEDYEDGVL